MCARKKERKENFYKQFSLFPNKYISYLLHETHSSEFVVLDVQWTSLNVHLCTEVGEREESFLFPFRRKVRLIEINNWKSSDKFAFPIRRFNSSRSRFYLAQTARVLRQPFSHFLSTRTKHISEISTSIDFGIEPLCCHANWFHLRQESLSTFAVNRNSFFTIFITSSTTWTSPLSLEWCVGMYQMLWVIIKAPGTRKGRPAVGAPRGIKRTSRFRKVLALTFIGQNKWRIFICHRMGNLSNPNRWLFSEQRPQAGIGSFKLLSHDLPLKRPLGSIRLCKRSTSQRPALDTFEPSHAQRIKMIVCLFPSTWALVKLVTCGWTKCDRNIGFTAC